MSGVPDRLITLLKVLTKDNSGSNQEQINHAHQVIASIVEPTQPSSTCANVMDFVNINQEMFLSTNPLGYQSPVMVNHSGDGFLINTTTGETGITINNDEFTPPIITVNLNNALQGFMMNSTNTPIDLYNTSSNNSSISTPVSYSSSPSTGSGSDCSNRILRGNNKIGKQGKMQHRRLTSVLTTSSSASSSTDNQIPNNSTSTAVQFINHSGEEMKSKCESNHNSQTRPKRKRGRPKKPDPKPPSKYEFVQEDGHKSFVLFHLSSREYRASRIHQQDNSLSSFITFANAQNDTRSPTTSYNPFSTISQKIASLKLHLNRLTFTGKQAPDAFDPESSDYWQGIGTIALGGGIISLFSILALLFFDTIRGLGCFGGIEPTKQIFYGREQRKQPYGQCQTFSLKILLAVMLVLIGGLCTILIIGNVIFNVSFENGRVYFKSTLVDMFNTTINLQTVANRIQVASGSTSDLTDISTLISQQQTALNSTNTLVKEIRHMNFLRYFLLMVIAVVMLSVPLFGLLGGLTHWKEFASYGVRFGYMMLVCAWVLFTIHFAFAVVTQDMCATADDYLQGTHANTTTSSSEIVSQISSLVSIFSQCANSSLLVKNSGVSMELVDGMLTSLNQQLTDLDSQKRDFYLELYNVTNAISIDFVAANPDTKASVQKSVDSILLFAYDLIPSFIQHNNCSTVGEKFVQFVDSGCVGMLSSIHILWAVFLILGTVLIPITWFNCLGYKRFRKKRFVIPKERQPEGVEIALNLT